MYASVRTIYTKDLRQWSLTGVIRGYSGITLSAPTTTPIIVLLFTSRLPFTLTEIVNTRSFRTWRLLSDMFSVQYFPPKVVEQPPDMSAYTSTFSLSSSTGALLDVPYISSNADPGRKRRSHKKSKRGCENCRRRRVKVCGLKNISCEYS